MPVQKYKKYYDLMLQQNKKDFDAFLLVHTAFVNGDPNATEAFHTQGRDIVDTIRFWERKLCAGMEKGINSQYSVKLAEKFWNEVKKTYTHIDMVGVRTQS